MKEDDFFNLLVNCLVGVIVWGIIMIVNGAIWKYPIVTKVGATIAFTTAIIFFMMLVIFDE